MESRPVKVWDTPLRGEFVPPSHTSDSDFEIVSRMRLTTTNRNFIADEIKWTFKSGVGRHEVTNDELL
jgi:hypothetical protein